jgi:hypothetical protein
MCVLLQPCSCTCTAIQHQCTGPHCWLQGRVSLQLWHLYREHGFICLRVWSIALCVLVQACSWTCTAIQRYSTSVLGRTAGYNAESCSPVSREMLTRLPSCQLQLLWSYRTVTPRHRQSSESQSPVAFPNPVIPTVPFPQFDTSLLRWASPAESRWTPANISELYCDFTFSPTPLLLVLIISHG